MARPAAVIMCAVFVVVVPLSAVAAELECRPQLLLACDPAIRDGKAPTPLCCSNLRAEEMCICKYRQDPTYRRYIPGPYFPETTTSCGIHIECLFT
ncbi:hypothetical protein ACQJBY_018647 [Aegilops geniculata]